MGITVLALIGITGLSEAGGQEENQSGEKGTGFHDFKGNT
jgi:hypothetical protein